MFHISQCSGEFSTEIVEKEFHFSNAISRSTIAQCGKKLYVICIEFGFSTLICTFLNIHNLSTGFFDKKSCYISFKTVCLFCCET